MDPSILAIFNAGGMIALSGVLFYLHTLTLKTHREDQRTALTVFERVIDKERALCQDGHEKILFNIGEVMKELRGEKK